MLEAPGHVADDLIGNPARVHPRGDHPLIFVGLGLLRARIGAQHQVWRLAARLEFDQQRRGIDTDPIGQDHGRRGGDQNGIDRSSVAWDVHGVLGLDRGPSPQPSRSPSPHSRPAVRFSASMRRSN